MKRNPHTKYVIRQSLGDWNWTVLVPKYSDILQDYFYGEFVAAFEKRSDARLFAKLKNDIYRLWRA